MLGNIRIRWKIFGLVGLLLIVLVCLSSFSVLQIVHITDELDEIANEDIPLTEIFTRITIHQLEQAIQFERGLAVGEEIQSDPAAMSRFTRIESEFLEIGHLVTAEITEAEALLAHSITVARSEASRREFRHLLEILGNVKREHAYHQQASEQTLALIENGEPRQSVHSVAAIETKEDHIDRELELALAEIESFTANSILTAKAHEETAITLILVATAGLLMFGAGTSLLVVRSITVPIGSLVDTIHGLADGNLELEVPGQGRGDAIGQMAKAVQVFKEDAIERVRLESELTLFNERLEQQVEKRTRELSKANQAKSDFLSSMSHELRTPLNAVLGFAQLLRDFPDQPLTDEQSANVEQILRGGQHLLGLVNEILDLSRIEAGRLDLSLEPIDPAQAVRESLVLVRRLADQHGISINVDPDIGSGVLVKADSTRLKQVIMNVLSNAVKYNRDQGTVSVDSVATDAGVLQINISDTGPGIPADKHDEVFRPFSRLGAEASKIEGTGIGLTISRQLIESMGGRLDFESTVGEGCTFWIEVPIANGDAAPAGDHGV